MKQFRLLLAEPRGCGTSWGLLHNEDEPYMRPAVLYTKKRRNESPMNGFLCVTMTAALSKSEWSEVHAADGSSDPCTRTYSREIVCASAHMKSTLINYPGM